MSNEYDWLGVYGLIFAGVILYTLIGLVVGGVLYESTQCRVDKVPAGVAGGLFWPLVVLCFTISLGCYLGVAFGRWLVSSSQPKPLPTSKELALIKEESR